MSFNCKKLKVDEHWDYGSVVARDFKNDVTGLEKELKCHFQSSRSKINGEKYKNAILAIWTDFNGVYSAHKKLVVDAAMFYGKHWTDFHHYEIYNCLALLTFPLYKDVIKAFGDKNGRLSVYGEIKEYLDSRCGYALSEVTIKDQVHQVIGSMLELGVLRSFCRGAYILCNKPIYDCVSIYSILLVMSSLREETDDLTWLTKCFNFELSEDFICFFPMFDYEKIVGEQVWESYKRNVGSTIQLRDGEWLCTNEEMLYSNGKRLKDISKNAYLSVKDFKLCYGKETFDTWDVAN